MTTNKQVVFKSIFSEILVRLIQEKRALGYRYQKGEAEFLRFDRFCVSLNHSICELTRDLVELWTEKKEYERVGTRSHRISFMRVLGDFMVRNGHQAWIYPTTTETLKTEQYIPYIFSEAELRSFFSQVDQCKSNSNSPHRQLIFSMLFRMLYGCGLRISEALSLRVRDVLLEKGSLQILQTKFKKDRLVPMHPSLISHCLEYTQGMHQFSKPEDPFFPSPYGNSYPPRTIYAVFREKLWAAGISHGGKGHGPRLHDLRHTFAVHSLKRWVLSGVDLSVALPYLSCYLGHTGLKSTQVYLRLTAELYPEIVAALEKKFSALIPDGE
jgi:integrase/recombinase XerD